MLGLGSYTFRWSIGHNGLNPEVPMSHADMLQVAAKHGLGLVQFADNIAVGNLSDDELDALAGQAKELSIALEIGVQAFDSNEVARYIAIAKKLDAKILRVALDGPDAQVPVAELAQKFVNLLPAAREAGVSIAVENHFNCPSQRLVRLMDSIDDPVVGICLDVANSICAGEWPMETINRLAPYAINLHLKDYDIIPDAYGVGFVVQGTPLGQGRTDCRAVLDSLPKDREINVILEHWLPKSEDMTTSRAQEHEWLEQSVNYARQELGL